jgi:hypothetical protein
MGKGRGMQGHVGRIGRWYAVNRRRGERIVGAGTVVACLFALVACGGGATPTASGAQQESITVTNRTVSPTATHQVTVTPARTTTAAVASATAVRSGTATAKPAATGGPEPGQYDCYDTLHSPARYVTSFTLNADGTYSTDEGTGKYAYNAVNLRVLFTSGPYAAPPPFLGAYDPRSGTIYLQEPTTEGPGFPCDP